MYIIDSKKYSVKNDTYATNSTAFFSQCTYYIKLLEKGKFYLKIFLPVYIKPYWINFHVQCIPSYQNLTIKVVIRPLEFHN